MTKYTHISLMKPSEYTTGGVQVFQEHLQRAVDGLELIAWSDYGGGLDCSDLKDFEKARVLNGWLLKQGIVNSETVVIADGYWAGGLEGKVARLVSVVHGSYFGRFLNTQIHPWGEYVGMDHIDAQFDMCKNPDVDIVCVSRESMRELEIAGLGTTRTCVIYNGVDLDVYYSASDKTKGVLMHAATSDRKGWDIIRVMMAIDSNIKIEPMNERSGIPELKAKRLNEARCLISPSRHEGNAYILLEALACGVPLIAYETGLVPEMDARCGLRTDDIAPNNFVRLLGRFDSRDFAPRDWVEENCSLQRFIGDWRKYLGC